MEKYIIPNLRNACLVLKHLAQQRQPRTLSEISDALGLPRTSALRILKSLTGEGFARSAGFRYSLGPALVALGSAAQAALDIGETARPALRRLTRSLGETSFLAIPADNHALIVEVEPSEHPLASSREPGSLAELHCSASGKCFLAFKFWPELSQQLNDSDLSPRTERTITTVPELAQEIESVVRKGFAVDEQELFEGVRSVAAPVFDGDGECVAAVGVSASSHRFPPSQTPAVAAEVVRAAQNLLLA